jgi:MFS family permease
LLALNAGQLHPAPSPHRAARQLRHGLRYAASVPEIIVPLLMMAVVGTFAFEFEVSLPLLGEDTFHGGADAYSWLLGAFGAGAVVGGLYAADKARTGVVRLTRVAVAYAIAMGLLAAMPDLWSAVATSTIVGLAAILFLTTGNATVQLASDPRFRGRVMALWSMALVGSTPIGAPIVGALSAAVNPRVGIAIGAVGCGVAAGIGWWAPSRSQPAGGRGVPAGHSRATRLRVWRTAVADSGEPRAR